MATGAGVGGGVRGYVVNTAYDPSGDAGTVMLAVRNDTLAPLALSDSNYTPLQTDSNGSLYVTFGDLIQTEDTAHTTGDSGLMSLGVRRDADSSLVSTDGDYAPLQINSLGAIKVQMCDPAPSTINKSTNNISGSSTLSSGIDASQTTIAVTDGTKFSNGDTIKIDSEYIVIGTVSSNDLTGCTRGSFNSTATSHDSATAVTGSFVGTAEQVFSSDVMCSLKTDVTGTQYFDFSNDGSTWDVFPTLGFPVTANVHKFHTAVKGGRYFRVRFDSSSSSPSTSFRIHTYFGRYRQGNAPLNQSIGDDADSIIVRAVQTGRQPDGDYVNGKADGQCLITTSTLSGGGTYTSDWIDTDGWNSVELFVKADVVSAYKGIQVDFTDDTQDVSPTSRGKRWFTFSQYDIDQGYKRINMAPVLDGFRITYTNGSTAQSTFFLAATLKTNQENTRFNRGQVLMTGEFETEVAIGSIDNYEYVYIKGRNADVDTAETGDVWDDGTNAAGDKVYPGQPTTDAGETVKVTSNNVNDTAAGTGARTVRIYGLKTSSSEAYESEDLTMNGTGTTTSTNTWYRVTRLRVLTAGSGGKNAGKIQVYNSTTTSNVFIDMAANQNESHNAVYTVPNNRRLLIKSFKSSIVRSNGSAGSAYILLLVRDTRTSNSVFYPRCIMDVQTGSRYIEDFRGGILIDEGYDIKAQITNVSDVNTAVQVSIECILLDKSA